MSSKDKQSQALATAQTTAAGAAVDPFMQQLPIRLVKNPEIKSNVMRFNATDFVPIEQWQSLKMWREKNEEQPQAGTENANSYRSRKRLHQASLKNQVEQKPWILNVNGKKGRKFRGTRSGGIGQHATYYVFNTASDGAIEAQRLDEFYNFQSISRFTPLTAEEAEEEYKRRKRVLNMFSIMTRKRLLGDEKEEEDATVSGTKKAPSADLKITDMDEWMSSSDCESDAALGDVEPDETARAASKSKKRKKVEAKGKNNKKSKPEDFVDEKDAFEESDDGDVDGREMDYDSESSEGEPDLESKCAMKSVAEEDALRKLLTSDGEDEEEGAGTEKDEENKNDSSGKDKPKKNSTENEEKTEETSSKHMPPNLPVKKVSSSKNKKAMKANLKRARNIASAEIINSATKRTNNKTCDASGVDLSNEKQIKEAIERPSTSAASSSLANDENSHLEEITKRYLSRKPISAVELLHKMKSKYSYLPNEKLLEKVTQVLKKINPVKSVSKGKMFFSLKKDN